MTTNVRSRLPKFGRIPKELIHDGTISSHAKIIFAVIDDANGYGYLSFANIAKALGVHAVTARRALYELRDLGWVEVVPQSRGDGSQDANEYVLNDRPFSDSPITTPLITGDHPPLITGDHPNKERDRSTETTTSTSVGGEVEVSNAREPEATPGSGRHHASTHPGHNVTESVGNPWRCLDCRARAAAYDLAVSNAREADMFAALATKMPDRPPRSWEPTPTYRARAEAVTDRLLNIDMNIDRYIIRCRERKTTPDQAEWLRWFLADEQTAQTEERRATTTPKVKAKWWDCDTY